ESRCVPDRRSTTRGMVRARWPGVAANLARPWQRIRPPQDSTGLGIQGRQAPAHAKFPAGDAAVDDAVEVEWCAGDGVAVLPFLNRALPHHLARLHVQGDDIGVKLAKEHQPFAHRQTTIDPAAADSRDLLVDAGPVLPEDLTGLGTQREDIIIAR